MSLTAIQQCSIILLICWVLSSVRSISTYGVYLKDSNGQIIRLCPNNRINTETNSIDSVIHDSGENEKNIKESNDVGKWSMVFELILISCCFLFILGTTLIGILRKHRQVRTANGKLFNPIQSKMPPKSQYTSNNQELEEITVIPN